MEFQKRDVVVSGSTFTEEEWYKENKWVDKENRIQLVEIASYINDKWVNRTRELERDLDIHRFGMRKAMSVMSFEHERREVQEADTYSKSGGDTSAPRMFTTSFPGKERGVLFKAIGSMYLSMEKASGDVHAMNDNAKEHGGRARRYPRQWRKTLSQMTGWEEMADHLANKNIPITRIQRLLSSTRNYAPEWFTHHWGPSAFHAARNHAATGSGVIVFRSWWAYVDSPWCKLEFLFCKCLAIAFPNSVYVVNGYDKNTKSTLGYFMKGDEQFEPKVPVV